MKFAEMTQEVQIARSNAVKLDLGFTPGRRQANKVTWNKNSVIQLHNIILCIYNNNNNNSDNINLILL